MDMKRYRKELSSYELKMLQRVYEPYRILGKLGGLALGIWLLFSVAIAIGLLMDGWILFGYGIVVFCMSYYIWYYEGQYLFYPTIEIVFQKFVRISLIIVDIQLDAYGHKNGEQFNKFYDEKLCVNRYKIICRSSKGRKVVLRTVMSRKRMLALQDELRKSNYALACTVTYGRFTHIIWRFENTKDKWADVFNHTF